MARITAMAVPLLLAACARANLPPPLVVPDDEAHDAIACGLEMWGEAARVTPQVSAVRVVTAAAPKAAALEAERGGVIYGWYSPDDQSITLVRDRIPEGAWCLVAAHELGHALGIDHAPPPALMAAKLTTGAPRPCLTPHDRDACARVGLLCAVTCGK